jgi:hypothetical protein
MLFAMLGSMHPSVNAAISQEAFAVCVLIVLAIEANGLFGKLGPLTTVKGVIHCSIGLTLVMWAVLAYL